MEQYVQDTELLIPDRKPTDRTIKRAVIIPHNTKKQPPQGHHGKLVVRKVSKKEMNKLWAK